MRTTAGILALVVAAVLATAAQAQTLTIRITSIPTVATVHDVAPKNSVNRGDWIGFKDLLVNRVQQFGKAKGKPVAYDAGTIRYTSATKRRLACTITIPRVGTISYGGPIVDRKDGTSVYPITGGTGGFEGATGTVTVGAGTKSAPNIVEVTIPGHRIDINGGGGVA